MKLADKLFCFVFVRRKEECVAMNISLYIRKARTEDREELSRLLAEVLSTRDHLKVDRDLSQQILMSHWIGSGKITYLVYCGGVLAASFYLEEHMPVLDSHIADAYFIVKPEFTGLGIGRPMAQYALEEAYDFGFLAIQFHIHGSSGFHKEPFSYRFETNKDIEVPVQFDDL